MHIDYRWVDEWIEQTRETQLFAINQAREFHPSSWDLLGSPGISWDLLGSPGISWNFLGSPGISWDLLGSLGISWALIGFPGISCILIGPWSVSFGSVKEGAFPQTHWFHAPGTEKLLLRNSIQLKTNLNMDKTRERYNREKIGQCHSINYWTWNVTTCDVATS